MTTTHTMRSWRAGCGGTRTSGSEGGGEETISRKADTAPRRRPLHIPFDPQAANLMFMLVSRRYERASMIVTSNKPFSGWGEIFGDDIVAAAMIDRLVHHAEIVATNGTQV
jgi:IstB-like ATP binding protein